MYFKNRSNSDYMFIVHAKNDQLYFDCYNDEWRKESNEHVTNLIPCDAVDPVDLKMAGGYIDLFKDKINFPDGIEREFIKFTFNNKIRKNI